MKIGEWFRVSALPGQVFQVHHFFKDCLVAYGGSKSPKGQRQYVSFPWSTNFIPCAAPYIKK